MEDRMGFICKGEMDAIMDAMSLVFFTVRWILYYMTSQFI